VKSGRQCLESLNSFASGLIIRSFAQLPSLAVDVFDNDFVRLVRGAVALAGVMGDGPWFILTFPLFFRARSLCAPDQALHRPRTLQAPRYQSLGPPFGNRKRSCAIATTRLNYESILTTHSRLQIVQLSRHHSHNLPLIRRRLSSEFVSHLAKVECSSCALTNRRHVRLDYFNSITHLMLLHLQLASYLLYSALLLLHSLTSIGAVALHLL
jgi:hypothetical protein